MRYDTYNTDVKEGTIYSYPFNKYYKIISLNSFAEFRAKYSNLLPIFRIPVRDQSK